jgi:hypothetical protein
MLFDANYGYHPSSGTTLSETNILSARSIANGHWMKAVVDNFKKELERSSERTKKYVGQSQIKPPSFEMRNLVMLNGKHIKTRRSARKPDHQIYRPFEILDIISHMAVHLHLSKISKIHPVFHECLIEPFVKNNPDVDLNAILKTDDPIQYTPEYDVDKVMSRIEIDGKV